MKDSTGHAYLYHVPYVLFSENATVYNTDDINSLIKAVVDKLIGMYQKEGIADFLEQPKRMRIGQSKEQTEEYNGVVVRYITTPPRPALAPIYLQVFDVVQFEESSRSTNIFNFGRLNLMPPERVAAFYPLMDNILLPPGYAPPLLRDALVLDFLRILYGRKGTFIPVEYVTEFRIGKEIQILMQIFETLRDSQNGRAPQAVTQTMIKGSFHDIFASTVRRLMSENLNIFNPEFLADLPRIRMSDDLTEAYMEKLRQPSRIYEEIAWMDKYQDLRKESNAAYHERETIANRYYDSSSILGHVDTVVELIDAVREYSEELDLSEEHRDTLSHVAESVLSFKPELAKIDSVIGKRLKKSDAKRTEIDARQSAHNKSFANLRIYKEYELCETEESEVIT